MVRYYKTTGIYDKADLLRVEVEYSKDHVGYVATINPAFKDKYSWGIIYNKEYYQYYGTLIQPLVRCSRRSKKQEEVACAMCNTMIGILLEKYVEIAEEKGGRHIEIIGDLED